jgi:hypothetical protein
VAILALAAALVADRRSSLYFLKRQNPAPRPLRAGRRTAGRGRREPARATRPPSCRPSVDHATSWR